MDFKERIKILEEIIGVINEHIAKYEADGADSGSLSAIHALCNIRDDISDRIGATMRAWKR